MSKEETQRYMELQMKELKATLVDEKDPVVKKTNDQNRNAEIAELYEDAAECEKDIEGFEKELSIVTSSAIKDMADALTKELPNEERNYAQELKSVMEAAWIHFVEVENTHPLEQLELIRETEFCDLLEKFTTSFPNYDGDFEAEVRAILIKRLETLITIKKEHLKEEIDDIYISGLKPSYAKRIYKQYHGIK